jgi:hypothetical protein
LKQQLTLLKRRCNLFPYPFFFIIFFFSSRSFFPLSLTLGRVLSDILGEDIAFIFYFIFCGFVLRLDASW